MTVGKSAKRQARQLFRLCLTNGRLDESRVPRVAQRIAAGAHRGRLPLLTQFVRLVRLYRERNTARIESAAALPADVQKAVESSLQHRYGPGLITAFAQSPSLIGGMRVQVGCDVYDGSVLAGLLALEKCF